MGFAQYAEETRGGIVLDDAAEIILRQAARRGDPRNLEQGGGGRNIGIEAACRRGDEIDRNFGGGIGRRQRTGIVFHPLDESLRRGTVIRPPPNCSRYRAPARPWSNRLDR